MRLAWISPLSMAACSSSLAYVLDAVGLDQSTVNGSLLVGVARGRQVREEVRPVGERLAVEPGIELVQDVLPGVQAFGVHPELQAGIPGLAAAADLDDPGAAGSQARTNGLFAASQRSSEVTPIDPTPH